MSGIPDIANDGPRFHRRAVISLYGDGGIVELSPRLANSLASGPGDRRLVVLLIDALGATLLAQRRQLMPALAAAWAESGERTLTSCFPSTTVTGLAAFGLGRTPGEHGLVGVMFPRLTPQGDVRTFLPLKGRFVGDDRPGVLRLPRRCISPWLTAGLRCALLSPAAVSGSQFQRRVFQACEYQGYADPSELPDGIVHALQDHRLVIGYLDWVDRTGHTDGIVSPAMDAALRAADGLFTDLRRRLPPWTSIVCCADHGLSEAGRVVGDEELEPVRRAIVRLCGDARCVHFWIRPGWRERVIDHLLSVLPGATVLTRHEAVSNGLYGPGVRDFASRRLGDLVLTFERPGEAMCWSPVLRKHRACHGGLAEDECRVPLITVP